MAKKNLPCGRPLPPVAPPPSSTQVEEWQKQLKNYLALKSLKYTEQRWAIAKMILETAGHVDAQELAARVKKTFPGLGTATVYRNLKLLIDAGILEESTQGADGRRLYELPDEDHHDHIICIDCGEIFEFQDEQIESLQEKIAVKMGFQPAGHRHMIQAHCEFLKKKTRRD